MGPGDQNAVKAVLRGGPNSGTEFFILPEACSSVRKRLCEETK